MIWFSSPPFPHKVLVSSFLFLITSNLLISSFQENSTHFEPILHFQLLSPFSRFISAGASYSNHKKQ
ncbi:hypothetical protein L1987_44632 [Smallanthus sonchifolius]|uniref:Uncharacterized protein n=1 Tax=Smallanthus sonchifolius TaxID=185202 RepID=A0ACB9GPR4_9ASTR|nr:hypothetical protein L1987_44632 [Smallanthus sonchifolius]